MGVNELQNLDEQGWQHHGAASCSFLEESEMNPEGCCKYCEDYQATENGPYTFGEGAHQALAIDGRYLGGTLTR